MEREANMKTGFLITFEGGDGCGKTTQLKLFEEFLKAKGFDYLMTREPGGTVVGEEIRNILLNSKGEMSSLTEVMLFSSSRAEVCKQVLRPALADGKIVTLDRFYDSTTVYQGYAGGVDPQVIKKITAIAVDGTVPDLTILLDISYEDAMSRKSKDEKLQKLDRIESKGKAYHDKVRQGYLKLAQQEPQRFVVIDARKSIEEIHEQIVTAFVKRYTEKQKVENSKDQPIVAKTSSGEGK